MTADQFHDALTLLPTELLAETDRLRRCPAKPRRIPYARYACLAASLAVVLFCGWFVSGMFQTKGASSAESVLTNEAAPQSPETALGIPAEDFDTAEAPAAFCPGVVLLDIMKADSFSDVPSVQLIAAPDPLAEELGLADGWFDEHDLLLLQIPGTSEAPQLLSVQQTSGRWVFLFPECPAGGERWYVLLEVEKGLMGETQVDVGFVP